MIEGSSSSSCDRREANGTGNQEKPFGDTRQFDVPKGNSGDTLRERINRANEQSLRRKREAASQTNGNAKPTGQPGARINPTGQPNELPTARQSAGQSSATMQPSVRKEPTARRTVTPEDPTLGTAHQYTRKTAQAGVRPRPENADPGTAQHPMPQNTTAEPAHQHPPRQNPTAAREPRDPQGTGAANGVTIRHDPTVSQGAGAAAEPLSPVRQEGVSPAATESAGKTTIKQRMMAQTARSEAAVRSDPSSPLRRERAAEKRSLQKTRVTDISSLTGHTHTGGKRLDDGQ